MSATRGPMSIATVVVLAALPVILYWWAFGEGEGTEAKLTIVSPHNDQIRTEFGRAFAEWYQWERGRPVRVEWLNPGGTGKCLRYVKSEFARAPSGIDVDLFFGGGVDPFIELSAAELTQPYKLPDRLLSRLPARAAGQPLYDPQYHWYGTALAGFGIVYNKVILRKEGLPTPQTWSDLADPKLFQWVEAGDLRKSGVAHMVYEIILQAYGWDEGLSIITRMAGNCRQITESGSQVPKDVSVGQVACGMCIDFYAWAHVARVGQDKIGFVLPEGKTVVNPDSIAILKGAPQLEIAQDFIRFTMGERGQKLWMLAKGQPGGPREFNLNRMSVLPHLYGTMTGVRAVQINPFEWKSDLDYDSTLGGSRWPVLNDLVGSLVIELLGDLRTAWSAIIAAGMPDRAVKELTTSPVTEAEVLKLAARWRDDQGFRNSKIQEWIEFGKRKYQTAERLARESR